MLKYCTLLLLVQVAACSAAQVAAPGEVLDVPGFGKPATRQYAGHLEGNSTCGAYPFFWLAESQRNPAKDPIIMCVTSNTVFSLSLLIRAANAVGSTVVRKDYLRSQCAMLLCSTALQYYTHYCKPLTLRNV